VHLRGSAVYRLLEEADGILCAGDWLQFRRGVTTNCNAFFYPQGPEAEDIEPEYLLPVLRSPRWGARKLHLEATSLTSRLFHCQRSEDELSALGHHGAMAWIRRGSLMKNAKGRPLPQSLSGRPWYSLRPRLYQVVFTKAIHDTHRHPLCDAPIAIDQRFYGVKSGADSSEDPLQPLLVAAALNSGIAALSAEIIGSTNLGQGALDLPLGRVKEALLIPDGRRLDPCSRQAVVEAFASMSRRPLGPLWEERARKDRRALDAAWFSGLGLPLRLIHALWEALEDRARIRLERSSRRTSTFGG